jgi:hypothetical protein
VSDSDDDGGGKNNVVRVDFAARRPKTVPAPTPTQPPAAADLKADRPEKLRMFARLIEKGMVMVTIDSRVDNARLPSRFAGELQLNLNFSHRFGLADFDYDDDGLRASLSFGGTPFFCDIPWTAVYGMTSSIDGERMLWPDSFPRELVSLLPAQARHTPAAPALTETPDPPEPPPPSPRPTLRRVK